MRINPQKYAREFAKTLGASEALRVARSCFEATQVEISGISEMAVFYDHRDEEIKKVSARERLRTHRFWDNVYGLLVKKVHPGLSRKQYLAKSR